MGDQEAFKYILFGIGNRCSQELICRWVMMSQCWALDKMENRTRQLEFILNNIEKKSHLWFYFDLNKQQLLYLYGKPKRKKVSLKQQERAIKILKDRTTVVVTERSYRQINN